jgi:hypothetical protein
MALVISMTPGKTVGRKSVDLQAIARESNAQSTIASSYRTHCGNLTLKFPGYPAARRQACGMTRCWRRLQTSAMAPVGRSCLRFVSSKRLMPTNSRTIPIEDLFAGAAPAGALAASVREARYFIFNESIESINLGDPGRDALPCPLHTPHWMK